RKMIMDMAKGIEFELREIKINLTYRQCEHLLMENFKTPMRFAIQNLDRMRLVLHSFPIMHRFESPELIGRQIAMTYKRDLFKQVYKLLFHIDILGNPASVLPPSNGSLNAGGAGG
ncbi:MAG: hypothetical protein ACPGSK_05880, partial [Alphaproteobacteria bacterium]